MDRRTVLRRSLQGIRFRAQHPRIAWREDLQRREVLDGQDGRSAEPSRELRSMDRHEPDVKPTRGIRTGGSVERPSELGSLDRRRLVLENPEPRAGVYAARNSPQPNWSAGN